VFIASVLLGRPLAQRLAADFLPLPEALLARHGVRRFFQRVSLWAVVFLANAGIGLWLLVSQPLATFCGAGRSPRWPSRVWPSSSQPGGSAAAYAPPQQRSEPPRHVVLAEPFDRGAAGRHHGRPRQPPAQEHRTKNPLSQYARDLPETALRATSRRRTTQPSAHLSPGRSRGRVRCYAVS
jgi:hypothetical protein